MDFIKNFIERVKEEPNRNILADDSANAPVTEFKLMLVTPNIFNIGIPFTILSMFVRYSGKAFANSTTS